jgi:hypothetical protein
MKKGKQERGQHDDEWKGVLDGDAWLNKRRNALHADDLGADRSSRVPVPPNQVLGSQ